ncbi:hypothetical protein SELMODRAFT_132091 [Selaginella moellendorffii]|uniref:Uncharacterized protein n=1 Tax=Selaginella moellendorffii TaxID=88036 RepID=D8T4X4_SELML|nr:hypothetical protein SELMODRAFT_132091 [Selaginella moellendorffii]
MLVLDDVESHAQLLKLLPPLGRSSRVIVTSRDRDTLRSLTFIHEVGQLKHEDARMLFKQHAKPDAGLDRSLVKEIVGECKGVPLVLEVAGLKLQGKSDERDWRGAKSKLSSYPEVVDKLRISLEPLHQREREIFLHICCFFGEVSRASVFWIWEAMRQRRA